MNNWLNCKKQSLLKHLRTIDYHIWWIYVLFLYAPFGSYAPFLIFWFTYCFFSLTSFRIYRRSRKSIFLPTFWSGLMKKQYVKSENRKEGVNLCAILYAPFDSYAPFLIFWFTYCFFSLTFFKSIENREKRFSLPGFWKWIDKKHPVNKENRKRAYKSKRAYKTSSYGHSILLLWVPRKF